jgi:site-specific recombinase XerD
VRAVEAQAGFFRARASRKYSPNTTDGYRRDLEGVMGVLAVQLGTTVDELEVEEIADLEVMREAFGRFASDHSHASVIRAHSTWSMYFGYLVSIKAVPGSPMPGVAKPPRPKKLPKPLPSQTMTRVVSTVRDGGVEWRDPWPERDAAVTLTIARTGCRSSEAISLNIGDVMREPGNEALRFLGKGSKERMFPVEPVLIEGIIGRYLDSARKRFPNLAKKRVKPDASPYDWWDADQPLFLGRTGERITREQLKYLIRKVFGAAAVGADRSPGALVHVLRHTAATGLAGSGVRAHELTKLFGWESLATAQHYIDTTAVELREAAAKSSALDLL